jgi:GMP synthase-like glutamine amidotransferase
MKPVVVVQNCEHESPGTIIDYLNDRQHAYQLFHGYRGDELPPAEDTGALIAMGTPVSVRDYRQHDHLARLFELMSRMLRKDQPILGVCFGGQLLAHALGAKVQEARAKEIGVMTVALTDDGARDPLMAGLPVQLKAFQWHGDAFRLPFDASWLATSENCKYQAFRKGRQAGIQFHLEVTPEEAARWCDMYSAELKEAGKTRDEVVDELTSSADDIRSSGYRLLDNFFALAE